MQGQLTSKDTYIDGHNVNGNNGEEGVIYIGRSSSLGAPLVGLMRFDTPSVSGSFSVNLKLVPQYCASQGGLASVYISLATYPLEWDEFTATWSSLGGLIVDPAAPTVGQTQFTGILDVAQLFDVTSLVAHAVQSGRQYMDLLVHPATEAYTSCTFYSKDSGTRPDWGPRLMVLNG